MKLFYHLKIFNRPLILLFSFLLMNPENALPQHTACSSADLRMSLKKDILDQWYPGTIDQKYGGFLCDFTFDWKPKGRQDKMIVTQARHIWTASQAAMFFHDSSYIKIAEHGFCFLRDIMWDQQYGGFFMLLDRQGRNVDYGYADTKTAYGNAFALYGLSGYYELTGDTSAFNLARKTFYWLESMSHDPRCGGYFDQLMRDGTIYPGKKATKNVDEIERGSWKDYNSSIHLLEAFTELYKIWPDTLLKRRIVEMLSLIRDTIANSQGYMNLYFRPDWTLVSFRDSSEEIRNANIYYDHVSFGHDIETAYLLLEAAETIGLHDGGRTLSVARRLVDHSLANGFDKQKGGFYNMGYYFRGSDSIRIINNKKVWWAQAEGLNSLLMMSRLFPEGNYLQAFNIQWNYINTYLIDHVNGEWYMEGLDNSPEMKKGPKATQWKINYHNSRALMNCIRMLESSSESAQRM
jgi:cellobiose epimerase